MVNAIPKKHMHGSIVTVSHDHVKGELVFFYLLNLHNGRLVYL